MRLLSLAVAVAITLAGCGGKANPSGDRSGDADDEESDDDAPFVNRRDFEPTAFSVEVRGEGRPIIFIPGLGCPGTMFDDAIERLGDGYQAHILTLAGFAGEKPIRPPLAAKTRKQIVRYIRSRHLDHPLIVGHSMGGFIAYWLATTSSNAIGGVVVIDAGPSLASSDDEEAHRLRNMWAQSGDDELPVQIRTIYSWMVGDPKKLEPYFGEIAKSDRQTIGDAIYEMVKTDVRPRLKKISVPLLLVLADGGLQGSYRQMAESVPHHEVVVLPKTHHFVWFDDPSGFAKTIKKFADKVFADE